MFLEFININHELVNSHCRKLKEIYGDGICQSDELKYREISIRYRFIQSFITFP